MHAREAVGEDATLEKAPQLALHEGREPHVPEGVELRQEALRVLAQETIEQRLRRIAATVASDASFAGRRGHKSRPTAHRGWLQPEGLIQSDGANDQLLDLRTDPFATRSTPLEREKLVQSYVSVLPAPQSTQRSAELRSEIDSMVFAWSGPTTNPGDVSFQLVGPSLVIDYACQDLGGDPLQHLHSVYRNPKNEYGE